MKWEKINTGSWLCCTLCEKSISTIDQAIEAGWVPHFYCGEDEYGCACNTCTDKYLFFDDEDRIIAIKPVFMQTFLDSKSSVKQDLPLAKMPGADEGIFPNRNLIAYLSKKIVDKRNMTWAELTDLIDHYGQLVTDLELKIDDLQEELRQCEEDF